MRRAFSLVELSIVLVILGLLVGGILAGQSLIRAAELRSVTTEYGRYLTAAQAFRDKYFYLPGDMANAQSFWGVAANCPGTQTQGSTSQTTCNGDGDGKINPSLWAIATTSNETFRFWQHLANAGMIEGTYDGVRGSAAGEFVSDTSNSPRSRIGNNVVWFPWNWNGYTGDGNIFNLTGKFNIMTIGRSTTDSWPSTGFLKPEELWNLDKKMDDGMPARGSVIAVHYQSCALGSGASDFNAVYRLDYTATDACGAMFTGGF